MAARASVRRGRHARRPRSAPFDPRHKPIAPTPKDDARRARHRAHAHVPLPAILLIVGSVLLFTILDSTIKILTQRYSVPVLVWARYGVQAVAMMLWLLPQMGTALLRTRRPGMHLARAAILPLSSVCFFSSLKYLPLAEATAINYSTPVLVVILAVIFLHERMTQPRIALVVAGIAGMLLIVRPGSAVFQGAALLAMGAAVFYATFQILTRKLASEDSRVLLFYPALVGTLMMSAVLPWYGIDFAIPWTDAALIVGAGLLGTLGHFLFILAFQRAPASGLTPYTYIHLVWATIAGWIVFGSFPDAWTLAGMAVITGSGLLIALHERRRAKSAPPEPTTVD
jgi:drug/metabolite transporter (DMT)-like permease